MKTKEWCLKEKIVLHRAKWGNSIPYVFYDAIFEAMEEYAELYAQSRWIPCSERLPENDSPVLVSNGSETFRASWIAERTLEADYFHGDTDDDQATGISYFPKGFYEWNHVEETRWLIKNVTHWQELPSKPIPDSPNLKK